MSEKVKNNASFLLQLVKSSVLGVLISIVLVLILAFVLKFVELSDGVITILDEIIKIISIFIATINLVKKSPYKLLYKGALIGAVYTILTFIVFSALRGNYTFGATFIVDIIMGAVVGIIVAIMVNIFKIDKVAV